MTTITKEVGRDEAVKSNTETKAILLFMDESRIERNEVGLKAVIPYIQTIYDKYNSMPDIGKLQASDIPGLISVAQKDDVISVDRVKAFIIKKAKKVNPLIDFGGRKVDFEACIKSGLITLDNLFSIESAAAFAKMYMNKKTDAGSYTFKIIKLENEKFVFDQDAFNEFVEKECSKYATTESQIEKYNLLNTMLECERKLIEKGHLSINRSIMSDYTRYDYDSKLVIDYIAVLRKEV